MISYHEEFLLSCGLGKLDRAIHLYNKIKDLRIKNIGFVKACITGNLIIAQWLYFRSEIDYRFENDAAFHMSLLVGAGNVIEWLCTIGDYNAYLNQSYNELLV